MFQLITSDLQLMSHKLSQGLLNFQPCSTHIAGYVVVTFIIALFYSLAICTSDLRDLNAGMILLEKVIVLLELHGFALSRVDTPTSVKLRELLINYLIVLQLILSVD